MTRLIRADLLKLRRRTRHARPSSPCSSSAPSPPTSAPGSFLDEARRLRDRHRRADADRRGGGRDHRRHRRRRRHRVRRVPRPRGHRPLAHRAVLLARARRLDPHARDAGRSPSSLSALLSPPVRRGEIAARHRRACSSSGALTAAVCVGLAALTGSRGPVMGIALAFQLGVAPLLAQLDVLGDARWAIPSVAISRLDGAEGLVAALPLARRDRDHPRLGRRRTRRRPLENPHPGDLNPT